MINHGRLRHIAFNVHRYLFYIFFFCKSNVQHYFSQDNFCTKSEIVSYLHHVSLFRTLNMFRIQWSINITVSSGILEVTFSLLLYADILLIQKRSAQYKIQWMIVSFSMELLYVIIIIHAFVFLISISWTMSQVIVQ